MGRHTTYDEYRSSYRAKRDENRTSSLEANLRRREKRAYDVRRLPLLRDERRRRRNEASKKEASKQESIIASPTAISLAMDRRPSHPTKSGRTQQKRGRDSLKDVDDGATIDTTWVGVDTSDEMSHDDDRRIAGGCFGRTRGDFRDDDATNLADDFTHDTTRTRNGSLEDDDTRDDDTEPPIVGGCFANVRRRTDGILGNLQEEISGACEDAMVSVDQVLNVFTLTEQDIHAVTKRIERFKRQLGS